MKVKRVSERSCSPQINNLSGKLGLILWNQIYFPDIPTADFPLQQLALLIAKTAFSGTQVFLDSPKHLFHISITGMD